MFKSSPRMIEDSSLEGRDEVLHLSSLFSAVFFSTSRREDHGKTIRFRDRLIYNPPPRWLSPFLSAYHEWIFILLPLPDVAATRNASLFPRDSSRTCHFYTLLEPFISPFSTPFSLNFFPLSYSSWNSARYKGDLWFDKNSIFLFPKEELVSWNQLDRYKTDKNLRIHSKLEDARIFQSVKEPET